MESITVDDLIQEIRDQSDEQSDTNPTAAHLLRGMNRAQRLVNQILARDYADPLILRAALDLSLGATHDFPVDCFEGRIQALEITIPGSTPVELRAASYTEAARQATSGSIAVPWSWDIEGEQIRLLQMPTGAYDAVAKYVRKLDPYVVQRGRVSAVGADYIIVDTADEDLDSASDSRNSYINFVDAMTGRIRGTCQIANIVGDRINLRASPVRSSISGRDVSGSADFPDLEVGIDDYICFHSGTCVPQLRDTVTPYIVEYMSASLSRTDDDPGAQLEQTIMRDMEARVETSGSGRPATDRVRIRSQAWSGPRRVWPTMRTP